MSRPPLSLPFRRLAWLGALLLSRLFLTNDAAAQGPPPRAAGPGIPPSTGQLVVSVADGWNSMRGRMYFFFRQSPNAPWQRVPREPVPVLFGKNGLAWGNGALPVPHGQPGVPSKREKDRRAPAGAFRIGKLYSYHPAPPPGVTLPYHQVTARDCWIDDVNHPAYNRHVMVDPNNPPPWYEKQRMRLGDFAYEFLLEIRHNSDPPIKGHGSAIFFHLRRGPNVPSAGCTTMARPQMLEMLRWLRPEANPLYVCLPKAEYQKRVATWGLPPLPE